MEEDENDLCRFGTPLDPLEEDEVPSKKPIAIEDQIVTDSNGRRRFHGAFTGGFSAGFWNTVGSLEGWKPQSFKSSRAEKAEAKKQRPTDFMDDEDLGEFGIAPQRIQTTEDFTPQDSTSKLTSRKRKLQQSCGPIPGVPVLHHLLKPAKENVAIRLLKKMGWKIGQGIGARQTKKEKKAASDRNARERYIMKKYGCDLGPMQTEPTSVQHQSDSDESDISDEEITFAPDDFEPYLCGIKDNTFGLGYSGLCRNPVLKKQQHIDLFGPFEIMGKDNKKLSIRGQAFGVGALEEDDDDIYEGDDMTKYDFSLEEKKKAKPKKKQKEDSMIIEGFHVAKNEGKMQKKVFTITVPASFKPRNWAVRKSRFEPLDEDRAAVLKRKDEHKTKGLGRHDLNPDERGSILGERSNKTDDEKVAKNSDKGKKRNYLEKINEKYKRLESKREEVLNLLDASADKFAKGETLGTSNSNEAELDENARKENEKVQEEAKKLTKSLDIRPSIFKPFINNEAKQERYEKLIEANLKDDEEITKFLATIQPLNMSEWDREMEKKEFLQARSMYKPLKGLMSDRFVSEATVLAEKVTPEKQPEKAGKKIEIKRTKVMWKPCAQLCKRFNIPEPFGGSMVEEKVQKKARFSVFDYLETSINTKDNFVTPVIRPTKAERPKPIIQQFFDKKNDSDSSQVSAKHLFAKDIDKEKVIPSTSKQTPAESTVEEVKEKIDNTTSSLSSTIAKDQSRKSIKPKSDLEKKLEECKNKHPSEKKDLFKAIFESSSEDEDENEEQKAKQSNEESDNTSISKDVIQALTKPATELSVLRNTSPPRGIFAYLFKERTRKPVMTEESNETGQEKKEVVQEKSLRSEKQGKESKPNTKEEEKEDYVYGPKIPTNIISPTTLDKGGTSPNTPVVVDDDDDVEEKLLKLLKKSKKKAEVVEEWIEKSETCKERKKKRKEKDRDKKKKSKKHKKEKRRHKDKI